MLEIFLVLAKNFKGWCLFPNSQKKSGREANTPSFQDFGRTVELKLAMKKLCDVPAAEELIPSLVSMVQNHVLSSVVFFHPSIMWPKKGQQPQILPQRATSEGVPYKHLCHMYLLQIKHYSCLNSAFPWVSTSWSGNLGQPHTRAFSQW